jgi:Helicase conserved C-terminal domain
MALKSSDRFDMLLGQMRSNDLKSMMRLWGGRTQTRKDDMLAFIRAGLADPDRVHEAIAGLKPIEREALALMKWMDGSIDTSALVAGLRASGVELPKARNWYDRSDQHLLQSLIQRGLLVSGYEPDPSYIAEYHSNTLFSDERLLAEIGPPAPIPLAIQPAAEPSSTLYRRPPTVVMDILGLLQTITNLGSLQLTKTGSVRVGDLRKLTRALKWNEERILVDGLPFPRPVVALLDVLYYAGLVRREDGRLVADGAVEQFSERAYVEQIGDLLRGFLHLHEWREQEDDSWYYASGSRQPAIRLALTIMLMALPHDTPAFFAIDDLDAALFDRIGEYFSLSFQIHPPYFYQKTPEEMQREQQAWLKKLRSDWRKIERPWIDAALTTWLYYIGVVELGFVQDRPVSLRLTEMGRAVLQPSQVPSSAAPTEPTGTPWLVQPDFEVVVYLDQTAPEQIAFIERHAERFQSEQHIARYKLTRESIYRGLESGTTLDDLIVRLRQGASVAVPQNVLASIRDWAARRDQIILRRRAALLEFPDVQTRQQALEDGLAGIAIGECFVLLAEARPALPKHERLNYAQPLPPYLALSEEGLITLKRPSRDLLIRSQLDRWADPTPDGGWQLTEARVAAAIKAGSPISDLTGLLQARLTHAMPPLLAVALRGWAGRRQPLALATITVLRCANPAVFAAITGSALLAPYLSGTLAPDVLLVKPQAIAALRERLAWAGFELSETLDVQAS